MHVIDCEIPGLKIIEPKAFGDSRGYFMESYNQKRYQEIGIPGPFLQDNLSFSAQKGVLRGLHFQHPKAQGKLVCALEGEVFDVAVDIRLGSPHFGRWIGVHLSAENKRQFWIPKGFAHGFIVLSQSALFAYKCDQYYAPDCEGSILWNDSEIGIDWPLAAPILSDKDQKGLPLKDFSVDQLPKFEE